MGSSKRGDRIFLSGIVALMLFLARGSFRPGLWADNDSVCHLAYLRHLRETIWQETGSILAYSPSFNLGVPFLVFNTPPGLYAAALFLGSALGVSSLTALKIVVVAAFASVPLIGFALARTFEDAPPHTPRFVAVALALFSSELYGTWFFFRNGMLNAAVAIPLMLAALLFFRRAQIASYPRVLRELAFGGLVFGALVVTHLLSAYMTVVAIVAFIVARGLRNVGFDVVKAVALLGLGGALAAWWVLPSVPFAPEDDAVYTWIRPPREVIFAFLDGSLFASNFRGFFDTHTTISNAGLVALGFGVAGIVFAARRYEEPSSRGPLSSLLAFLAAFSVMLGPTWSFGLRWLLPSYDRLLWYRFLTLAQLSWLVVAGLGAAYLFHAWPRLRFLVVVAFVWPFLSTSSHAMTVETTAKYGAFEADYQRIAEKLRSRFGAEKRGRVYSEFLAAPDEQPPSVNSPRHLLPIDTGVPEVAGWVYENNLASRLMQKRATFWMNPLPFVDDAPAYDVKWIVASSPQMRRALASDPRWKLIEHTSSLALFEHAAYAPRLAEGHGLTTTKVEERWLTNGGYEYALDLGPSKDADAPGKLGAKTAPLVVKVGYLPRTSVWADDQLVTTKASRDGLLEIVLPEGPPPKRLRVVWQIDDPKKKGDAVTFAGLLVFALLLGLSFRKSRFLALARPVQLAGIAIAVVAPIVVLVRGRNVDLTHIGFGVRDGIDVPGNDPLAVNVGTWDDDRWSAPVHVVPSAWTDRALEMIDGALRPARRLRTHEPAFLATFSAREGERSITLNGAPQGAPFTLAFHERRGRDPLCTLTGSLGERIVVKPECLGPKRDGELPGIAREVSITPTGAEPDLIVTKIAIATSITIVEAETFANVLEDGGRDTFHTLGPRDFTASGGLVVSAWPSPRSPIDMRGSVMLPEAGEYEVLALMRLLRGEDGAQTTMRINGVALAPPDAPPGAQRPLPAFGDPVVWEWRSLGTASIAAPGTSKVRVRTQLRSNAKGVAQIDAFAFVAK